MLILSGQAFSGWVHWWIWRTYWKGRIHRWACRCHEILARPWPFYPDSHCIDVGGTSEGRPTFRLVYSSKSGGLDTCSQWSIPSSLDHLDTYCPKLRRHLQGCQRVQQVSTTTCCLFEHHASNPSTTHGPWSYSVRVLHFTNFLTVHQKNLNQIYFISGVLSDRYECYSKEYSCLSNYGHTHACDNYYTNCT